MRGRGGYGPPARGGYPPRGGRGGYGPPPRGAYGAGGMRGGRTPPPQGYNNVAAGQYDTRGGPAEAYGSYDQRPVDPYSSNVSANPSAPSSNGGYAPYNPEVGGGLPRAESPPPLPTGAHGVGGEAIEMDATPTETPKGFGQFGQLRDSDVDVAGMVGLQQGRAPDRHDTYMSDGSKYSSDECVTPLFVRNAMTNKKQICRTSSRMEPRIWKKLTADAVALARPEPPARRASWTRHSTRGRRRRRELL